MMPTMDYCELCFFPLRHDFCGLLAIKRISYAVIWLVLIVVVIERKHYIYTVAFVYVFVEAAGQVQATC